MINGENLVQSIVGRITDLAGARMLVLVGIDGPGAAGKSTLAGAIALATPVAAMVCVDDFFLAARDRGEEAAIGGAFDWRRLDRQVLAPLRDGAIARYQRYDWATDALAEWHAVEPAGVVLVEGVYATRRELRDRYDLRLWVDCPRDLRLSRGVLRDGEAARARWTDEWMPAEDRYQLEHRPSEFAHLVVDGTRGWGTSTGETM